MKESNTFAGNVAIMQLKREILFNYKAQYIKVSSSPAGNVTIFKLFRCIKDSNTFTGNVTIKHLLREIKVLYMKVSSTHTGNAIIKQF